MKKLVKIRQLREPDKLVCPVFIVHGSKISKKSGRQNSGVNEIMEILSAGSFINLENQAKIEQLKFTAAELAKAALGTTGFVNTQEAGKNLGLEFWQGLEYLCRETEEAAVRNIFLNHFLDRLREFRPVNTATVVDLPSGSAQPVLETNTSETKLEDEFLGVIQTETAQENSTAEIVNEIDEDLISRQEVLTLETAADEREVKTTEFDASELAEEPAPSASESEEEVESASENAVEATTVVGNLSVPEKEPYQWGKCTVTTTIQLLPLLDGAVGRKAVLSVKTHDFAPQFALVELPGNDLTAELAPELEKVLAKYKNDLPVKVMDKLKREKLTAKKNTPKTISEAKTVLPGVVKPKESGTAQTTRPEVTRAATPVVSQSAPTGQQGSLFG